MNALKAWYSQVTTGGGAMAIAGALLAVISHQMTWEQAAPLVVGGLVGLIWPENKKLVSAAEAATTQAVAAAPAAAASAEAIISAYRAGINHGVSLAQGPSATTQK